jgi:peptide chain release factor subunit 3
MIIGTVFADYAGLVISAKEGEYEMGFRKEGQTREHIHIAKILGVEQVIVVVTKMDDPTVNWSETRFNNIKANLTPFLIKRGYEEKRISFVPISGLTGQNVLEPIGNKCPWYKGMTLIQILDKLPFKKRDPNDPLRIPIIDKMEDFGVIAHGKIESGMVRLGDKVIISPSGYKAQIGEIHDHKNGLVKYARPGENVMIKLIHIDDISMINKGDVITSRDSPMPVTELFEADIKLFKLLDHKQLLTKGYSCVLHLHTILVDCTITEIISLYEKNPQTKERETRMRPSFVKS